MPYFEPSRPMPLRAAERRDLGRDDAFVDADDAVFEPLGHAPDAADVAAVEIGGERPPFPGEKGEGRRFLAISIAYRS